MFLVKRGGYQMSEQQPREEGRPELPIERGFPIERVNEIAEKESRAKQWYRPIYTMHKWWARRPGSLFRAISLYSLTDRTTNADNIEVYEPGQNQQIGSNGLDEDDLIEAISKVDMDDPESLWDFYPKDVRIKDKKILDPFMGGGTSLVEASRFGADTVGIDLNPVAWFVTKKELEAGQSDVESLEQAFEQVRDRVSEDILQYYRTPCPNGNHKAEVVYNFWVKEINCVSCDEDVPLFKDYRIAKERYVDDPGYSVLCPSCGSITVSDDWKENTECGDCNHVFVPKNGNVSRGGYYNCPECGQKESITDAIAEQGKPEERLYAVEYYCSKCDEQGHEKSVHKGYKKAEAEDKRLFEQAKREWRTREDLHDYVPQGEISRGAKTVSSEVDGPDVFKHGYNSWDDMYNERQLLCLASLLNAIESVPDSDAREYLLLAFSDSLMFQSTFTIYNKQRNNMEGIFRMNSYGPQTDFVENNIWGAEFGRGNFRNTWEKLLSGIRYAKSPTDRYVNQGEMVETPEFAQPIGRNSEIHQGDMRKMDYENEFDAVITDPPYYDNIIYSDLSDYFYVWQKILLKEEYDGFDQEQTPREESIVTNPYLDKTADDFEHEMGEALEVINKALKEDGTLAFTYHHSDEESWGELLESLCENDFEVTATYPINSDLNKFIAGEAVAFDIVIVARPTNNRKPISWDSLRRRIVRTARETRETLEENRELASGDIGVIEMGKCFQEYSKHHGEVHRAGEKMSAKNVVDEIYGIIQDNDRGEQDVYRDLLEEQGPTYNDLNKHLKRSDASEEQMKEMQLFRMEAGEFILCKWNDEKRQAYVQNKVQEANGDLTTLDKAHFLRYRFEQGKSTSDYLDRWNMDELRELCEGLAEATNDVTYLKMIGVDTSLTEFESK
jgi:adenine-specific DNA methylase